MPRRSKWVAEFKFANWFQACNVARHILHCHNLINDDEHDRIEAQTRTIFPEHKSLQLSGPTGPTTLRHSEGSSHDNS